MKLLILSLMISLVTNLNADVETPRVGQCPIEKQILKNRPKIDKRYAYKLQTAISKSCIKHKIPCDIYTAILMQESKYELSAINFVTQDHGISQINRKTALAHGFDLKRLTSDLNYSVEAGAIILADFMRMYGKRERDYWTRYNSSKPSKRAQYFKLVVAYK